MDTLAAAPDPEILTRRIAAMIGAGQLNAAEAVLAALRRLTPPGAGTAMLAARLALAAGRMETAIAELDVAIDAAPAHAALRRMRADLLHRRGAHVPAAIDAAEAVALDPANPAGKAILGVLLSELGRPVDAVACLREALAADPANPAFIEALAAAEAAGGDTARAAATLAAGIARAPGRVELRNAAMLLAIRRRDFATAVAMAEAARRAGAIDACLFGLHGHALSCLGADADAADAYDAALKLAPQDPYVRHLVAASGALPGADRAPSPYVRAVFEGYADRFESHLIALGYRVPGLFRAALLELAPWAAAGGAPGGAMGPVLDLGCGTGLAGLAISDLPIGTLHGVDLSPRMLAQAAAKGIYATLTEADVLTVLGAVGTGAVGTGAGASGGDVPGAAVPAALRPPSPSSWPGLTQPSAHEGPCADGRVKPGHDRGGPAGTGGWDRDLAPTPLSPPPSDAFSEPCALILAADVLCYFGALDPLLPAAFARLRPGGHMLLSCETAEPGTPDPAPWQLGRQGRYTHRADYVRQAAEAAGFRVLTLVPETQRYENQCPVPGLLSVLARP